MSVGINIEGGINIGGGITVNDTAPILKLSLDAAGYTNGPWVDSISGRSFTLYNSPIYDANTAGGCFTFTPSSSQYAYCATSLPNLSTWTVIAWHYYTGTNTGYAPCILTELFPSNTNEINYSLGTLLSGTNTNLQAGYFYNSWYATITGVTLTAGNWYQIVGTFDGTTTKLYINNGIASSVSNPGTPISGASGIRLMRRWDDADYWGGKLAIVQVYDGAMDATQVTTNWNNNRNRFGL